MRVVRTRRSRTAGVAAAGLACALVVAGCTTQDAEPDDGATSSAASAGSASEPTDGGSAGESPAAAVTVEITVEGGEVSPNGDRVEVPVGEPIAFEVTADAPGELHVHSDPEQEIAYDEGAGTYYLQIDRPGVVEVESHDAHQVIVQLEAR